MKNFKKRILGKLIRYKFVELKENAGAYGLYDHKTNTILLDKELKGNDLLQTRLHEEFHCVLDLHHFNVTNLSDDLQEIICEALSQFLVNHYKIHPK